MFNILSLCKQIDLEATPGLELVRITSLKDEAGALNISLDISELEAIYELLPLLRRLADFTKERLNRGLKTKIQFKDEEQEKNLFLLLIFKEIEEKLLVKPARFIRLESLQKQEDNRTFVFASISRERFNILRSIEKLIINGLKKLGFEQILIEFRYQNPEEEGEIKEEEKEQNLETNQKEEQKDNQTIRNN